MRKEAGLTDRELKVMEYRWKGKSIVQTAMDLNMSVSTVNADIKKCKKKYDEIQRDPGTLRPRAKTQKELYK